MVTYIPKWNLGRVKLEKKLFTHSLLGGACGLAPWFAGVFDALDVSVCLFMANHFLLILAC